MDEKIIARNIKKFRLGKEFSLEQLAQLTGLTKGYLSKVERSDKAPPFSTLIKIAQALEIDISVLLSDESDLPQDVRLCVVRKDEGKVGSARAKRFAYSYRMLAHRKLGKNMEPYLIMPAFEEKAVFSHEGEEFMYVLEGTHEFIYDGKAYLLNKGDSIYFDSIVPHSGRSLGAKKAKVLAVMFSYKRKG